MIISACGGTKTPFAEGDMQSLRLGPGVIGADEGHRGTRVETIHPQRRLNMLLRCRVLVVVFAFMVAVPAAHLWGQAVSGTITGAVTDPSGSAIPGANVKATNAATGVAVSVLTTSAGYYTISNLIAGTYTVEVAAPGFKTYERSNVDVSVSSVSRLDIQMTVGSLQEQVTVNAVAPQLKDDQVNLGGTITSYIAMSLPTIGNNPTALIKLQPGVIEEPGQEGIPGANGAGYFGAEVNGQRSQLNNQLLDGVEDVDPIGGQAPIVPSLDATQEVSFNTTNYDVEFGQVAGGVSIMTTRSGTNEFHGSGYEYNRVNALFARNPFSEPNGPGHFVWNQFGASAGGPAIKNKLFGFFNYQGVRVRSGGNVLTTSPTEAFRNGDFSSLNIPIYDPQSGGPGGVGRTQFPNNKIPADRLDKVVQNVLALVPLPNQPGTDLNFLAPGNHPISQDMFNWRVDYALTSSNRFFVRHTRTNQTEDCPGVFGKAGGPGACGTPFLGSGSDDSLAVDYTHVFSPGFLVEGRFGWTAFRFLQNNPDADTATSEQVGIPNLNNACQNASDCGGLAGFRIGGPVGAFDVGNTDHSHQLDDRGGYNYVGIATWTHGSHSIKFGADIKYENSHRFDSSSQGDFGCFNGGLCAGDGFARSITGIPGNFDSGLGMASFLLGLSSNFQRIVYTKIPPTLLQKRDAIFFQDTWRVTRKLTLNLGVRWDYVGYPTAPYPGGLSNFNFVTGDTIIADYGDTTSTANVKNNKHDFAPRLGVAYRVTQNTVVRAGFARAYSIGFYGANFGAINNQWPNATRQHLVQPDPYTPALLVANGPPPFVSGYDILQAAGNPGQYPAPRDSTPFGTDPDNPTHSIDMWNLAVQHQFGQSLTATVAYVGNAGRHLFYRRDYNAAVPGPGPFIDRRRYGSIGYQIPIYNQSNQSSSGYHAMQIQVEKRYSAGLSLIGAVTWSKSYDFGLHNAFSPFDQNMDRAPQDTDRALTMSLGHVWDLPFGRGKKFISKGAASVIAGGWQFSGISRWYSGTPFSPVVANGGAILNSDCCNERPDRVGTGTISNPTRDQWFDVNAFTLPAQYTFGNAGRNILRGPSFSSVDLGLTKKFEFTEQIRMELSWQAFNAFNRTNLGNPVTAIDSSLAGRIFGLTHFMRRQQLGVHFYW
jgi:outer membrane receptor protein involved in Fe transport